MKTYQHDYARQHQDVQYDIDERELKAHKIIAILADVYEQPIKNVNLLDIGCSTGIITSHLACAVKSAIGVDIDTDAIDYANSNYARASCSFEIQDSLNLSYKDNAFDIVVCNHIYEHVPDPVKMMAEIYRVLRPCGICYFAASNRLTIREPHYRLPFLSYLPKSLAHIYLRIFTKHTHYYENLRTVFGLNKLTKAFERTDYTLQVIRNPDKFKANDMIKQGSMSQRILTLSGSFFYLIMPTYIWILKKQRLTLHSTLVEEQK